MSPYRDETEADTEDTENIHSHFSEDTQTTHSHFSEDTAETFSNLEKQAFRHKEASVPQIHATIDVTGENTPMTILYYSEDVKNTKQRNNVKSCKGKCHLTYKGRISIAPAALNIRKPRKTRTLSIQAL